MLTKDGILVGLKVKFPEVEEVHLEWAATILFTALKADESRTNEIFFARVEAGLRSGEESAIQIAMASVRNIAA